jgi:hypothetical protein
MNAMDSAHEEGDVRMQVNPVYEENPLQQAAGAYEQPHMDTWAHDLYNTQESESRGAVIDYDTLQQMPNTYEHPHIDTWARDLYDSQEDEASATIYGAPTIPVRDQAYASLQTVTLDGDGYRETNLNPQGSAWSAAYDTVHGGAKPLAYETILPDQQPWDESAYDLNLPAPGATGDYIDITVPLDSRV